MKSPFVFKNKIKNSHVNKALWALKLFMGENNLGSETREHYEALQEIQNRYESWLSRSLPDRLSPQELEAMRTENTLEELMKDCAYRREVFESEPLEETFQGMSMPLIRHIIKMDSSVKKVVEVGAYYGYVLSMIAREFPHLDVFGIDFSQHMVAMNQEFTEPNLKFATGYGLEELEKGTLTGDLFYFISTATRFKNLELKRYFELIRQTGKYIVLNEFIAELPGDFILNPELVSPDESVPFVYKAAHPDYPPQFIHNYRKIAEQTGFEVLHYRVFIPKFTKNHYRVEMVAKKKP